MLGPCATQAHWQNGIAERAIKTVFDCARSLHKDRDTDLETAVHQAVEAHNAVERVDGYCPTQWAFGRDKNWSGTLTKDDNLDIVKCSNQSCMENLSKRVLASKILETGYSNNSRRERPHHVTKEYKGSCQACWYVSGDAARWRTTTRRRRNMEWIVDDGSDLVPCWEYRPCGRTGRIPSQLGKCG